MRRNLIHLVHVIKKDLLCEVVPSLSCLCLALLELLLWDDFFKLLQEDHSYALDAIFFCGIGIASHGLVQWTCIATKT